MSDPRRHSGDAGGQRSWSFADCIFDEANWTLTVGGRRVAIESKPLEILRQLLLRPQQVVSKGELLDAIWPGIVVVEASLSTAVHKLRLALADEGRETEIIETVPRIGYRLAVGVAVTQHAAAEGPLEPPSRLSSASASTVLARLAAAAVVGAFAAGFTLAIARSDDRPDVAQTATPSISQVDRALRRLDVEQIETFVAAGWDVNMAMDADRNTPLNRLLDMCEWNPAHDRQRMLLMARTLVDAGTRLTDRNSFGDTPYSIAKTPRFCGASHPVTIMLHRLCYNGGGANTHGDRCLASYELERRRRGAS